MKIQDALDKVNGLMSEFLRTAERKFRMDVQHAHPELTDESIDILFENHRASFEDAGRAAAKFVAEQFVNADWSSPQ